MLLDRMLAASRNRRATEEAILGVIFTLVFISTLRVTSGAARDAHAAMATIYHLHGDADHLFVDRLPDLTPAVIG
jgi:hypothetical protein